MYSETDSTSSYEFAISRPFDSEYSVTSSESEESFRSISEEETPLPIKRRRKNKNIPTKVSGRPGPSFRNNNLRPNLMSQQINVENFTKTPGLKIPITDEYSILDFFHLLFDKKMCAKIVEETNKYAIKERSEHNWENLTDRELSAFLGMVLGISCKIRVLHLKDIWDADPSLRQPYFANVMPCNRFFKILTRLHFNDKKPKPSEGSEKFDRIYKFRPVIDQCNANFKAAYQLHREIAVQANTMMQSDILKPRKRDFKWWICSDCHNGYVYHMEMYADKKSKKYACLCVGAHAVKSVVLPHLAKQHHIIFCGRFFSSIELAKELYENKLYLCGAINIRKNGIPKTIKMHRKNKMKRGDSHFVIDKDTGLQFLVWMDKKPICMITNAYAPSGNDVVNRQNKNKSWYTIPCPPAIKMYNKYMGGVYLANQKQGQYWWDKKLLLCSLRPFWHCFQTAISNAYILYSIYMASKHLTVLPHLQFRRTLSHMLIDGFSSMLKYSPKIRAFPCLTERSQGKHTQVDLRHHNIPLRKRCVVCSIKKQRHETRFGCLECGLIPICNSTQRGCFAFFHTQNVTSIPNSVIPVLPPHMSIDGFSSRLNCSPNIHVFPYLTQQSHGNHTQVDLRHHNIPLRKRCVVCSFKKQRHETCFGCLECGLIPICNSIQRGCFAFYHTQNMRSNRNLVIPVLFQASHAVSSQMDLSGL